MEEMGRRGLANRPLPLARAVLMDPNVLTSAAFTSAKEKEAVPAWRDGEAGEALQAEMVRVAVARYFQHDMHKNAERQVSIFATGSAWASFARLARHVEQVLESSFGAAASWPDMASLLHRELWRGEHDTELVRLAMQLPANLDNTPSIMQKRLQEMFLPLSRLFRQLAEAESVKANDFTQPAPQAEPSTPPDAAGAAASLVGDVTDALAAQRSPQEKAELVEQLNKDAEARRKDDIRATLNSQAAMVVRNRLVPVSSADAVKTFCETAARGLVARSIVVDVTMPVGRQSGPKSRQVSLAPSEQDQKAWAAQVKTIPAAPVVGNVIVREAQHSVEVLNDKLANTHAFRRSVTVPIALPEQYLRYVRSGAARANGPNDTESTGVDFIMRTIGKRVDKDGKEEPKGKGRGMDADVPESSSEGSDEDVEVDGRPAEEDARFQSMVDPAIMTNAQMKSVFGKRAPDMAGILFQHSARITAHAAFLPRTSAFMWRKDERAPLRRYRKGQLDVSVWVKALASSLSASNIDLSPNEALVALTGGTPEVVVAGMILGFKKVFYVSSGVEHLMMTMPTPEEERERQIDWDACPFAELTRSDFIRASSVRTIVS